MRVSPPQPPPDSTTRQQPTDRLVLDATDGAAGDGAKVRSGRLRMRPSIWLATVSRGRGSLAVRGGDHRFLACTSTAPRLKNITNVPNCCPFTVACTRKPRVVAHFGRVDPVDLRADIALRRVLSSASPDSTKSRTAKNASFAPPIDVYDSACARTVTAWAVKVATWPPVLPHFSKFASHLLGSAKPATLARSIWRCPFPA